MKNARADQWIDKFLTRNNTRISLLPNHGVQLFIGFLGIKINCSDLLYLSNVAESCTERQGVCAILDGNFPYDQETVAVS